MASRQSSTRHQLGSPKGRFSIEKAVDGWTTVKYELSPERVQRATNPVEAAGGVDLLRINADENVLTIFPVNTLPDKPDFLQPRYDSIRSISLEGFDFSEPKSVDEVADMLEGLPSGFLKDPEYGLGLLKDLRFIIQAIGQIENITKLLVSKCQSSDIDGDTYVLSHPDFELVRKAINRTHAHAVTDARKDKAILAHNALLTARLPVKYPEKHRPYKADTVFKAVTGGARGAVNLSPADKTAALTLVSVNKKEIAKSHPQELLELRREIELVTLEQLIEKLEKMIAARHGENQWQQLFLDNPFILSLAFGLPIVVLDGLASVGGRKLDGTGDKIADFLLRNGLTDNITLMEIKTPAAKLLGGKYRGGVFAPSPELAATVVQALDQRYQLQKSIAGLKDNSKMYDLESYAIKCVIVIGTMPRDSDQRKSLELFRNNLNDVLVITFDELLEKLRYLRKCLSSKHS